MLLLSARTGSDRSVRLSESDWELHWGPPASCDRVQLPGKLLVDILLLIVPTLHAGTFKLTSQYTVETGESFKY